MKDQTTEAPANPHTFTISEEFPSDNLEAACEAEGCDWRIEFTGRITDGMRRQAERLTTEHRTATDLTAKLAEIRENQLGLARGFLHDAAAQRKRSGGDWHDHTVLRAEGAAHGAVTALQVLLVLTGEVEYDEEADAVWDLVARTGAEAVSR